MNKKLIPVIGGTLVLLLGGGAGAYVMLGKSKPAPAPVEAPTPSPPIYVNTEAINVPVMRGNRVSHYFYVTVALQVGSEAKREQVRDQMPRLRDAFLRDLTARPPMRRDIPDDIDFDAIKQRLLAISTKMLGAGVVDDVLIVRSLRGPG